MSKTKPSDYIDRLERRRHWLESRVSVYTGKSDSYDQAELSALTWAINQLRGITEPMSLGVDYAYQAAPTPSQPPTSGEE